MVDSHVTSNDLQANHGSHDEVTYLLLDPGQEELMSPANSPGEIELEWETGIRTNEHGGDGAHPIFPHWAWPSAGDRVWANGNWVYD